MTPNYSYLTNNCLLECPVDLPFRDSSNICQKCGGITKYYDSKEGKCVESCPSDLPNTLDGICVKECQEGFYKEGIECVGKCSEDNKFTSEGVCFDTCPSNVSAYNDRFECLLACEAGFFPDDKTKKCIDNCPAGNKRSSNSCLEKCPDTLKYESNTGICMTDCVGGYPLKVEDFKRCYAVSCPDSHPYVLNNQCLKTFENALVNCTNTIISECSGKDRFFLKYVLDKNLNPCNLINPYGFNRCVEECPPGTLQSAEEKCEPTCDFDKGFVFLDNRCINCKEKSDLLPFALDNKCVKACPESYFFDDYNVCIFCDRALGEIVYRKSCISQCPLGYVYEEKSNYCRKLNENCEDDEYSYKDECYTTCPIGTIMNPDLLACVTIPSECSSSWCEHGKCDIKQANTHFPTCICDAEYFGIQCNSKNYNFVLSEYKKISIFYKIDELFITEFSASIVNGESQVLFDDPSALDIFTIRSNLILDTTTDTTAKLKMYESRLNVFK